MNKNMRSIVLMAALAIILVIAAVGQQKSGDTAVDPVCGMTVAKATAKATYDYKGTTYYFCNTGCKEAFAKDPEKYLKAQAEKAAMMDKMPAEGAPMGHGMAMHGRMQMMHGGKGQGMMGQMPMGMGCGPNCPLRGQDVEMTLENTKDGVNLKVTSKNPEAVKAIQEHMTQHVAMMKKMKDQAGKADKAPEGAACANCPMKKDVIK